MTTPHDAAPLPTAAEKADQLYHDYLAGGPDAAYKSLKADYEASAGMCNRDEYWKNVGADLQASGHMPNIAIGWLKAEKGQLDRDGDGVIEYNEVQGAKSGGGLNAMFANEVTTKIPSPDDNKTFFDQIAHTKRAWTDSPDGIEDADLRKYSRQMVRAERHVYNQNETAKDAQPLLDNNEELAKFLDQRKDGSAGNGFISRHEMKEFLKGYKEHQGEGLYTPENAEYVNELLHGEIGRVQNHPFHGFGMARLERRAGVTATEPEVNPQPMPPPLDRTRDNCDLPKAADQCPEKTDTTKTSAEAALAKAIVPTAKIESPPLLDEAMRHHIDRVSRVQPNEGYNAVAARLLNIFPGHPRTPEEVKEIQTLGHQIQKMNGDTSTLKLRTGVVLPVSGNIELLIDESPQLKKALQDVKANLSY